MSTYTCGLALDVLEAAALWNKCEDDENSFNSRSYNDLYTQKCFTMVKNFKSKLTFKLASLKKI